jgi:hypothetical protein
MLKTGSVLGWVAVLLGTNVSSKDLKCGLRCSLSLCCSSSPQGSLAVSSHRRQPHQPEGVAAITLSSNA